MVGKYLRVNRIWGRRRQRRGEGLNIRLNALLNRQEQVQYEEHLRRNDVA